MYLVSFFFTRNKTIQLETLLLFLCRDRTCFHHVGMIRDSQTTDNNLVNKIHEGLGGIWRSDWSESFASRRAVLSGVAMPRDSFSMIGGWIFEKLEEEVRSGVIVCSKGFVRLSVCVVSSLTCFLKPECLNTSPYLILTFLGLTDPCLDKPRYPSSQSSGQTLTFSSYAWLGKKKEICAETSSSQPYQWRTE